MNTHWMVPLSVRSYLSHKSLSVATEVFNKNLLYCYQSNFVNDRHKNDVSFFTVSNRFLRLIYMQVKNFL